ncbi:hypothetical protein CEUSTIGMA_g12558.t1, partial [Chlamydomonas eustigma]
MIADRAISRGCVDAVELQRVLELVFHVPPDYASSRLAKIQGYKMLLAKLSEHPVIEQKSEEWLRVRQSIVTASDLAQALGHGKFGTQKEFLIKKSGYEEQKFDAECPPLKWGIMFEDIACAIYERRNSCKVLPFGLIRHPTIQHFGASPDGVTENGVMLEIKCPYRRKITNEVPEQYYYQIQGQLDVCNLEECDYLECEFRLLESDQDLDSVDVNEIGAIIEEDSKFTYSPVSIDATEVRDWVQANKTNHSNIKYWALELANVIRVKRDRCFFERKMKDLLPVWEKVLEYRNNKAKYDEDMYRPKPRDFIGTDGPHKGLILYHERQAASYRARNLANNTDSEIANYKTFSRIACNFVFPEGITRPRPKVARGENANEVYNVRLGKALHQVEEALAKDPQLIEKCSPKMHLVVRAIANSTGSCVLYSEFRTAEGIRLLEYIASISSHET